jgi:hypothetical protein
MGPDIFHFERNLAMPNSRDTAPKRSQNKLAEGLSAFKSIKDKNQQWMDFLATKGGGVQVLFPHAIYSVRLNAFLDGKPLSSSLKKTGWMYFLRGHKRTLACAEVSIVAGKHRNTRIYEGTFVNKAFALIEKAIRNPHIRRRAYELRSIRIESAHMFCLWLKAGTRIQYFIPVTAGSALLKEGTWVQRKEFTAALRSEGERIRTAHQRMSTLLKRYAEPKS